jgi:hypothetical protein
MKFKTLRNKVSKEFVEITSFTPNSQPLTFTSEFPFPLAETATLEAMKKYYNKYFKGHQIDFDNLEIVEFDLIESGVVGADIRNKLSPCLNLVSLLKVYFKEPEGDKKKKIQGFIRDSMKQSLKSVKYLSKLL